MLARAPMRTPRAMNAPAAIQAEGSISAPVSTTAEGCRPPCTGATGYSSWAILA